LLPGLYAEAQLQLDQKSNVPSVPIQALNHEGGKTTVWTVSDAGQLQDRTVKIGLETSSYAEIVSGASNGEDVVVSDRSGLKPGEKVRAQTVAMVEYQDSSSQ